MIQDSHPDGAEPVFRPTYRLIGFCLIVGVVGAMSAMVFDFLVEFAQHWLLGTVGGYQPPTPHDTSFVAPQGLSRLWLPVVTTLGGLLSGFIVYRWAPEAEGHGTDAAVGAYHTEAGEIRNRIPFIKAIASALTIGSGGVAGREGPAAQISVGLGAIAGRLFGLRGQERRTLLLASMAAGLAAIFRAPLGMAIFAVEILYAGMVFESEALIYTVIAAVTSYAAFGFFNGWEPLFAFPTGLTFDRPLELLGFALLGILAGVVAAVLPTLLYRVRDLFLRMPGPPHIRPAIGGLIVGLGAMAAPEILGTGYGWVELAVLGQLSFATILILLLVKGPAMALTIGSGGSGGVFAPTVTLGAMLGAALGMAIAYLLPGADIQVPAFVVVGMAAVFAGAARTPISTLIMVAEMTGSYGLIVPAMLANILAFLVQSRLTAGSRYPTLYESQVVSREDSPLHRGVFVRRALQMIEGESLDPEEFQLPRLVSLLRFGAPIPVADGRAMLVALDIEEGARLADRTVAETFGSIAGATAVAVLRGEEMLTPRGDTHIEAGDRVLVVAKQETLAEVETAARGTV